MSDSSPDPVLSHFAGSPIPFLLPPHYTSFPVPPPSSVSPVLRIGVERSTTEQAVSLWGLPHCSELGLLLKLGVGGGVQGSCWRPVGGRAPGRAGMSHPALDGEQQRRAWVGPRCIQKTETWQDVPPPPVLGVSFQRKVELQVVAARPLSFSGEGCGD